MVGIRNIPNAVYENHHSELGSIYPPFWLDFLFVLIMAMIHVIYSFKFTKFSLAYLNAKCEEKRSGRKWSKQKLYLNTLYRLKYIKKTQIESHIELQTVSPKIVTITDNVENKQNEDDKIEVIFDEVDDEKKQDEDNGDNTLLQHTVSNDDVYSLWSELAIFRNSLRILLFVSCFIATVLWIVLQINIIFEFLISCLIHTENASYLAIVIFPALIFINVSALRYIWYGITITWSINADDIASSIAFKKDGKHSKVFALSSLSSLPRNEEEKKGKTDDVHFSFMSAYWMAFHWRLIIVSCCIIHTSITLLIISFQEVTLQDSFWFRLLLRNLCIASVLWLFMYTMISFCVGLYGRIRSGNNWRNNWRNNLLQFFCLMHVFGVKDENKKWIQCRFILLTLLILVAIICMIIYPFFGYESGLLWFVGVVNLTYYICNILLTAKPRGLYYLWKTDMISLELVDDDDDITTNITRLSMYGLSTSDLRKELSLTNISNSQLDSVEHDDIDHISLFLSLCDQVNKKQAVNEYNNSFLTRFKMNIYSVFKQYKCYWLLILPYNYDIRPLSVLPNGRSIFETFIKTDCKNTINAVKVALRFCWNACKGMLCCCLFLLILIGALHVSVAINEIGAGDIREQKVSELITGYEISNNSNSNILSQSYPICHLKWNANLSVIDLTLLSRISYDITDREKWEFGYSLQQLMCAYFDRKLVKDEDTLNCSWQIKYHHDTEPVFMHIRHEQNKTDVIVIRGTGTIADFVQDASLFGSVFLLQMASWLIPITSMFPTQFIVRIVYLMSFFEGNIDPEPRKKFSFPVFNYSYNLLINSEYEINSLYFVGHSLGGGISQIVAAQINHLREADWLKQHAIHPHLLSDLEIKSYGVATPGLVYNSMKFSIDLHDLFVTSTILKPTHDVVSSVDVPGGMSQVIECDETQFANCHLVTGNICRLLPYCNIYESHNPHLIDMICKDLIQIGDIHHLITQKTLNESTIH